MQPEKLGVQPEEMSGQTEKLGVQPLRKT